MIALPQCSRPRGADLRDLDQLLFELLREAGDVLRRDLALALRLVPYAVWCGFATALSAAIARRNAPHG